MKVVVKDFVNEFVEKKIMNNKINDHAVEDFIRSKLEIKKYLPFKDKRNLAEIVVGQNIQLIDGVKKYDNINSYIGLVVSALIAHTNLEFSADPIADYDLLAESGLLPLIIAEFKQSYDDCDVLLKMAIAYELEDNNLNVIVGKFLNGILGKLYGVGDMLKGFAENFDLSKLLGTNINEEEKAKFIGLIDKLK